MYTYCQSDLEHLTKDIIWIYREPRGHSFQYAEIKELILISLLNPLNSVRDFSNPLYKIVATFIYYLYCQCVNNNFKKADTNSTDTKYAATIRFVDAIFTWLEN